MAQLIHTSNHNGAIKQTWLEDGKTFEKMIYNFDADIADSQRAYNDSVQAGVYSRGSETFVEEMRIPEALWWHIREMAVANGRKTHKEISEFALKILRSPDYAKFRTSSHANKFKKY